MNKVCADISNEVVSDKRTQASAEHNQHNKNWNECSVQSLRLTKVLANKWPGNAVGNNTSSFEKIDDVGNELYETNVSSGINNEAEHT